MIQMKNVLSKSIIIACWSIIIVGSLMLMSGYRIFEPSKEITIFAWGDMFDEDIIAEFERETGITVNLSFYATNEELLAKFNAHLPCNDH